MPETRSFAGFEYPTGEEALTIPASFMQQVVAYENLSTVRVVGYMLTRSLEGERVIEASYEDLRKAMHLSRCAVHEGLKHALERGYILLIQAGENGHTRAQYAVNWLHKPPDPKGRSGEPQPEISHPENRTTYPAKQAQGSTNSSYQAENHPVSYQSENQLNFANSNLEIDRIELEIESGRPPARKPARRQSAFKATQSKADSIAEFPLLNLSGYLTNLSRDFSRELGDESHTSSNRSQTMNLWHKSKLGEKDFAGLMYQARELTRRYAVLRPGEKEPEAGQVRNRMAYFFTVLRNLVEEPENKARPITSGYALADQSLTPTPTSPQQSAITTTPTTSKGSRLTLPDRRAEREKLFASWQRMLNPPVLSPNYDYDFDEEEQEAGGLRNYV